MATMNPPLDFRPILRKLLVFAQASCAPVGDAVSNMDGAASDVAGLNNRLLGPDHPVSQRMKKWIDDKYSRA